MKNEKLKILILTLSTLIISCGHSQTPLSGPQGAPVTTNGSLSENTPSENGVVKAVIVNEYQAAPAKNSAKNFVSPLTKTWASEFQNELGFSSKEVGQLYRSSLLDKILRLSEEDKVDWSDFLPKFTMSRWFFSRCRYCQRLESFTLGSSARFLTGTNPVDEGKGSRPAVAFDPIGRNYLIVWDEKGTNGGSDIFAKLVGEDGTTVRVARKQISVARSAQGCLFANFAEATGLTAPTDCKENVEPSVAYNDRRFLITWTKRGKAVRPVGETFSVILGMLVNAATLNPDDNWKEGILLSKISFTSNDPAQEAESDAEVQAFSENEHSAVAPFFGTGTAQGTFLLVWDTTKDFVGCVDSVRRTTASVYGRAIPVNFSPQGGNRDIFPVYTDPSTASPDCAPNADVTSARRPRLALLASSKQYLVVFETGKNVTTALSSIGGVVVSLANNFNQTVSDFYAFATLDNQLHEGCTDPDVVATSDRFLLADAVGKERLKLTEVTLNRGNIVPGTPVVFEAPEDLHVQRPRLVVNRVVGQEGGEHTYPLEYVVAYEAHLDSQRSTASEIHVVSFSQTLQAIDPRVILPITPNDTYPTNLNPALASAEQKVLVAWNGQSGDESRIFDSLITVNAPAPVQNQKPTAVIGAEGHEEDPVTLMSGETLVLSGAQSSDPENGFNLSSYHWQQTAGTLGSFENADAGRTNFTAPNVQADTNLTIRLVVKDQQGLASDPVQITIRVLRPAPVNNLPVAKISFVGTGGGVPITELTVDESPSPDPVYDPVTSSPSWPRTRITLSGQFSNNGETPPGAVVSHRWEQVVDDATVVIADVSGENGQDFSFTVPDVLRSRDSVVITIRLTVEDGGNANNIASQDIRITVNDLNHRPTAPVLVSPMDGATWIPVRGLLDWQDGVDPDTADGDQLTYDVYWDTDNPPTTLLPSCTAIGASRCVLADLMPQTAYSWKVRVRDSANEDLPVFYSAINQFSTTTVDIRARWKFDDGTDGLCEGDDESQRGIRACDSSDNQYHLGLATGGGGSFPLWVQDRDVFLELPISNILNLGLGFNERNYAITPDFRLDNVTTGSIEFWFLPVTVSPETVSTLFQSNHNDAGGIARNNIRSFLVQHDGNNHRIIFTVNDLDSQDQNLVLASTNNVIPGEWNHVVCAFGSGNLTIYINGQPSSQMNIRDIHYGTFIGDTILGWNSLSQGTPLPPEYIHGVFDEIVFYNEKLDSGVIQELSSAH